MSSAPGVNGDTKPEDDENFFVTLSGASNASILLAQGTGTILNDDAAISISDVTTAEGDSGTHTVTFTASLSKPSFDQITVDFASQNGSATAGEDYTATGTGTLTFAPGSTTQTFNVTISGDTKFEGDETFFIKLTNPVSASDGSATIADDTGTGTISNDDAKPTLSISNSIHGEGNAGASGYDFTVTLTGATGLPITVDWNTQDGTAVAPSDYSAGSGTLTFPVSASVTQTQTITVQVIWRHGLGA